jgi:hypothetical protein
LNPSQGNQRLIESACKVCVFGNEDNSMPDVGASRGDGRACDDEIAEEVRLLK